MVRTSIPLNLRKKRIDPLSTHLDRSRKSNGILNRHSNETHITIKSKKISKLNQDSPDKQSPRRYPKSKNSPLNQKNLTRKMKGNSPFKNFSMDKLKSMINRINKPSISPRMLEPTQETRAQIKM
jgi:hypothetical protein